MAKDKYTITNAVDIVGTLDQNQDEKLVVYVESGKGTLYKNGNAYHVEA